MVEAPALAAALLLGLGGGAHCLGMCGGIGAALGTHSRGRALPYALAYNSGRVAAYAALGAIAGGIVAIAGSAAGAWLPAFGAGLRTVAGLLLVAMGLYMGNWWLGLRRLEALGAPLWRRVQPLARTLLPPRSLGAATLLGALWGLLPCGLIYSGLLFAAASGSAAGGALLMAAFGAGTLPALLLAVLGGSGLQRHLQTPWLRRGAGALLIALGFVTALAPWSHHHSHTSAAGAPAAHAAHTDPVDHTRHHH